jgi:hypothetical protein
MPADLTAASRHEHLVLYDPAAIPPDLAVDPDLDPQGPTEDCEARLRVFVDPSASPCRRATTRSKYVN